MWSTKNLTKIKCSYPIVQSYKMSIGYKLEFESLRPPHSLLFKNYTSLVFVLILLTSCSGTRPELISQFPPCPDKPNCVSSKSSLSLHKIAPLTHKKTSQDARLKLLKIIKSMPRSQILADKDNFIHVEFTSKIFQFVDDVEFYFEEPGKIHFRSASRVGHSDMGINRGRMEEIRRLFEKNLSISIGAGLPN